MNVLIATDAWHPQINGVVRTLEALCRSVTSQGAVIRLLTPEGFPSLKVPTYPGLRCAIPNQREIARRIARADPDAIHIATEGPIGIAVRRYCLRHGLPFTTSLTTRFAEYVSARFPVPVSWGYAALRHFHAAATATMVSTPSLRRELEGRGFSNLRMWSRGVDTASVSSRSRRAPRSAATDLHEYRPHRRREEPRRVPVARSPRHQGRDRRMARRRLNSLRAIRRPCFSAP